MSPSATARNLSPIDPITVYFLDLTTYDYISTYTSGTGVAYKGFGIAYVRTQTTTGSAACEYTSSQQINFRGAVIRWRGNVAYLTGNNFGVMGACRTALTNQQSRVLTDIHAAYIYEDGQWYASVANGTDQTISAITVAANASHFEIDGYTTSGHILFWVDGVLTADISTNVPSSSYSYWQIYVNNKATTDDVLLYYYALVYVGA